MMNCNSVSIRLTKFGFKLNQDHEIKKNDDTLYKQIIESLMYLTSTRPDIKYSMNLVSRYMENPTKFHLLIAKRILWYLKYTMNYDLFYKKEEKSNLIDFIDSDYVGD